MEKQIENELTRFMPRMMREFAKRRSNALTKGVITIPQMIVLEILYEKKVCSMSDIAGDIGVTTSAVTGITDRLNRLKLIIRKRDTKDRRVVFVTLAKKGKDIISGLLNQRKQMMQEALSALTNEEKKTYLNLIQKIYKSLIKK